MAEVFDVEAAVGGPELILSIRIRENTELCEARGIVIDTTFVWLDIWWEGREFFFSLGIQVSGSKVEASERYY